MIIKKNKIKNRLGKFDLPEKTIDSHPEVVMKIMSKCIILKAESNFYKKAIEYTAYSFLFDELPDYQMPKEYVWEADVCLDEIIKLRCVPLDEETKSFKRKITFNILKKEI